MDTRNTWQTGRALAIVALVYCNFIAAPRWCAAQLAAAAQNGSGVTANQQQQQQQQQVYEAGDVFLSGSRVYVLVGKTGFGHEHGVIGQLKQGRINLDNPRDAGGLEFDMASFTADTPEARKFVGLEGATDPSTQQQVNANMRGPDVLDASRFPKSTFVVKQIVKLDKPSQRNLPQYQISGDFTLHGVARPIQIVAEAEDNGDWIHLRGGFNMLQSQFGITPFTKAFGAVGVTDQLSVWGDLWISKHRQVAARQTTTRQ